MNGKTSLVVKTLPSNSGSVGLIPGWGTKISYATECSQKLNIYIYIYIYIYISQLINEWDFPGGPVVKNLPSNAALEEGMATHSSILAWRIPWTEEPGGLQPMGLQRVGHDWIRLK